MVEKSGERRAKTVCRRVDFKRISRERADGV